MTLNNENNNNCCKCTTPQYELTLNQQGPQGKTGPQGIPGFSPTIVVNTNTDRVYSLTINTIDGQIVTPNLKASVPGDGAAGYVLTKNTSTPYDMSFQAIPQATETQSGILQLATITDTQPDSEDEVDDTKAVTPNLLVEYTNQAIDNADDKYVTLDTIQVITGAKEFTNDAGVAIDKVVDVEHGSNIITFNDSTDTIEVGTNGTYGNGITIKTNDTGYLQYQKGSVTTNILTDGDIATTSKAGIVKPDGTTITVDADGTIHSVGGTGGTEDYTELTNKPQINGVELTGNKTATDLGLANSNEVEELDNELNTLSGTVTELESSKQDTLTAGQGITIDNNVISTSAQEIFVVDGGNEYTPNINTVLPVTEARDIFRTGSSSGDTTIGYINSFLNYRPTESEVTPVFDLTNTQTSGGPTGYAVLCFTTGADVTNLQFLGYETYYSRRVWITNGTISGKTELPVKPFTKYYLRFRYNYAGDPGNEWGMQISTDNQTWSTEVASGIRRGQQDLRLGYCNNSSLTGLPFQGTFHLDECVSTQGAYAYNPATGENSFEGYNVKAKDNENTILQGILYSKDGKNISVIRTATSIYGRALLFDSNTQSFKNGGYIHCNFNLLNKRLGDTATYNLFNLFPSYNTFISNSGGMTIQSGAEIVKFGVAQVNAANNDLINFDLTLSCIPTSSTNQYRMDIVLKNLTQGLENTNFFTFNNANDMMSLVMYPMLRESSNARTLFVSNLICESYAPSGERE